MFQLAPHTGLVETLGLTPKSRYLLKTVGPTILLQYFYVWFMWPKYMWLDNRYMRNEFCCGVAISPFCQNKENRFN